MALVNFTRTSAQSQSLFSLILQSLQISGHKDMWSHSLLGFLQITQVSVLCPVRHLTFHNTEKVTNNFRYFLSGCQNLMFSGLFFHIFPSHFVLPDQDWVYTELLFSHLICYEHRRVFFSPSTFCYISYRKTLWSVKKAFDSNNRCPREPGFIV